MALKRIVTATILSVLLAGAASASASIIYNTGNVDFSQIQQSAAGTAGTPAKPYGTPVIPPPHDGLAFNLSAGQFKVFAPSPGFAFLHGTIGMTVTAHPGHYISQLHIHEGGNYDLFGDGTAATEVFLGGSIYATVIGMDNQPVNAVELDGQLNITGDKGSSNGQFNLIDNGGSVKWNGDGTIDFSQLSGHVTELLLSVSNVMYANAEANTVADAQKNTFLIQATTQATDAPEPGTLALIALGIALLCVRRRKRALA